MSSVTFENRTYEVDAEEFLADFNDWDENFARGMAPSAGINSLSEEHWRVIHCIRDTFKKSGKCPLIYETCWRNKLQLGELEKLFPAGYLRGACKLAGVTYKEGFLDQSWSEDLVDEVTTGTKGKSYEVNIRGYLIDPFQWDDQFALYKAWEMKMPKLTDMHWQIILFLRKSYEEKNTVPSVYETCQANDIDIEKLHQLFPDGYHRGAVKLAGLRVR
jgi:TusE/DsrC/DsvC family sulfur relay protein